MSSLAAKTIEARLGFGSPGSNPLAAKRRVENLNGLFAFPRRFLVAGWMPSGSIPECTGRKFGTGCVAGSGNAVDRRTGFNSLPTFNKKPSYVRARIDTAHGPAWAAPRKHRHADQASADRPFCQGPTKHAEPSGENVCMRVNDNLKGMLGSSRAWAESGCFHPWQTYG